jgi:hypothetical protein
MYISTFGDHCGRRCWPELSGISHGPIVRFLSSFESSKSRRVQVSKFAFPD